MIEEIKKVYDWLEDEESKDIFVNRLSYLVTKEERYLNNMISYQINRLKSDTYIEELIKEICNVINGEEIIIYGAGIIGRSLYVILRQMAPQVKIRAFCDKRHNEMQSMWDVPIIGIDDLKKYDVCKVLITPKYHQNEIYNELLLNGVEENKILAHHKCDAIAKLGMGVYRGQYFDEIVKFGEEEVFVDGGSLDCETSFDFIRYCPSYKEIHVFEPNPEDYLKCKEKINESKKENINIHDYALWDKREDLCFEMNHGASHITKEKGEVCVKADGLDRVLNGKKVTFIKMDIEGAELNALKGARETILKYKPKLAISIYHKYDDIVQIPLYIKSMWEGYKLYVRHYSFETHETVLYAIPEDN